MITWSPQRVWLDVLRGQHVIVLVGGDDDPPKVVIKTCAPSPLAGRIAKAIQPGRGPAFVPGPRSDRLA
jgi:hypothetical protein